MFLFHKTVEYKYQVEIQPLTLTFSQPSLASQPVCAKWVKGPRAATSQLVYPRAGVYQWPEKPLVMVATLYARNNKFVAKESTIKIKQLVGKDLHTVGKFEIDIGQYCRQTDFSTVLTRSLDKCVDRQAQIKFTVRTHWLKELTGSEMIGADDPTASNMDGNDSIDGESLSGKQYNDDDSKDDPRLRLSKTPRASTMQSSPRTSVSATPTNATAVNSGHASPTAATSTINNSLHAQFDSVAKAEYEAKLHSTRAELTDSNRKLTSLTSELAVLHQELMAERATKQQTETVTVIDPTTAKQLDELKTQYASDRNDWTAHQESLDETINKLKIDLRVEREHSEEKSAHYDNEVLSLTDRYERKLADRDTELKELQDKYNREKEFFESKSSNISEESQRLKQQYQDMLDRLKTDHCTERTQWEDAKKVEIENLKVEFSQQIESLQRKHSEMETQLTSDRASVETKLASELELRAKIEADYATLQSEKVEIEKLRQSLTKDKERIEKELAAAIEKQQQREQAEREREAAEKSARESEAARLQAEIEKAREAEAAASKDREAAFAHLSAEEKAREEKIAGLQSKAIELESTIAALKAKADMDRETHKSELAKLQSDLDASERTLRDAEAAHSAALADQDSMIETLKADFAKREKEQKEREAQLVEELHSHHAGTIESLTAKHTTDVANIVAQHTQSASELKAQLESERQARESLSNQSKDSDMKAQATVIELNSTLRAKESELAELTELLEKEQRSMKKQLNDRDSVITELTANVKALELNIEELKTALEKEKEKRKKLDAAKKVQEDELSDLQSQVNDKELLLERLRKEREIDEVKRQERDARMMKLEQEQIDRESRIFSLEKSIIETKSEKDEIIATYQQRLESSESQHANTVKLQLETEAMIKAKDAEIEQLTTEQTQFVVDRDALTAQKASLQKLNEDLLERLKSSTKKSKAQQDEEKDRHESELKELKELLNKTKVEFEASLTKERQTIEKQKAELTAEKEALIAAQAAKEQQDREREAAEKSARESEAARLQAEIEKAREAEAAASKDREAAFAHLSAEEKAREEKIAGLQSKAIELESTIAALKAKADMDREALRNELAKLTREREELARQLKLAQSHSDSLQSEIEELKKSHTDALAAAAADSQLRESELSSRQSQELESLKTTHSEALEIHARGIKELNEGHLHELKIRETEICRVKAHSQELEASHTKRVETLTAEHKDRESSLSSTIDALKSQLSKCDSEIQSLQSTMQSLTAKHSSEEKDRISARYKLEQEQEAKCKLFHEQVQTLNERILVIERDHDKAKKEIEQLRAEIESKNAEIDTLTKQVSASQSSLTESQEQLKKITGLKNEIAKNFESLSAKHDTESKDRERLSSQVVDLETQLKQRNETIVKTRTEHDAAISALRQELATLTSDHSSRLDSEKKSYEKDKSALVAEHTAALSQSQSQAEKEREKEAKDRAAREAELTALKSEISAAKTREAEFQKEREAASAHLNQEERAREEKIQSLQAKLIEAESKTIALHSQHSEAVAIVNHQLATLIKERDALTAKVANLESQLVAIKSDLSALETAKSAQLLKAQSDFHGQLEKERATKNSEIFKLETFVNDLQTQVKSKDGEITTLKAREAQRKADAEEEKKELDQKLRLLSSDSASKKEIADEKTKYQKLYDEAREKLKSNESELLETTDKLVQLREKLKLEKSKVSDIEFRHGKELDGHRAAFERDLQSKNKEIALVQQQLSNSQLKIEELTNIIIEHKSRIQEINDQLAKQRRTKAASGSDADSNYNSSNDGISRLLRDVQMYHKQVETLEKSVEDLQRKRAQEKHEYEAQAQKLIKELNVLRERKLIFDKVNKSAGKGKDLYYDKMMFYEEQVRMADETMEDAQMSWAQSSQLLAQTLREAEDNLAKAQREKIEAEEKCEKLQAQFTFIETNLAKSEKDKSRLAELMNRFEVELVAKKVELANATDTVNNQVDEIRRLREALARESDERESVNIQLVQTRERLAKATAAA